ncbi:hypothetical protein K474DRAFT_1685699 [Panus rudis PR-1116 ss-1]|nr:hypothetical protein K474DRAFT_1685699 [Panus rudis PR-1116 ss-1]
MSHYILPGEQVHAQHVNLKLGPGLLQLSNNKESEGCYIDENHIIQYVPAALESVVGIVIARAGEGWRVGSIVYARVSLAHKDMEPELECFDAQTRKAEGFGELKGGFLVRCSLKMCRMLFDPDHFLLPLLGSRFPLEAATGMKGRIWVNAKDPRHIIAISRCIEAVDPDGSGLDEIGVKKFLSTLDI